MSPLEFLEHYREEKLTADNVVERVNEFETTIESLSNEQLQQKTTEFKRRLSEGATLDEILPEAFAVVREVAGRTLKMRHYDAQLQAGLALYEGKIALMGTGEGKTLAATLAVYLRALEGKGVHVITANDYLAKRDAVWMGQIYSCLGLTSGVLQGDTADESQPAFVVGGSAGDDVDGDDDGGGAGEQSALKKASRREAYAADITYGTVAQFGFDYLRDSQARSSTEVVQRGHPAVIVDELDSALADQARTPLILSTPVKREKDYQQVAKTIGSIDEQYYILDQTHRTINLTPEGERWVGEQLNLPLFDPDLPEIHDPDLIYWLGLIEQALRAQFLFERDKDYVVLKDQETGQKRVVVNNESSGRLKFGQTWSDELHQAIEAKEGVPISAGSMTFGKITVQSYLQLYSHLAGMTATTSGLEQELKQVYGLEVEPIPFSFEDRNQLLPERLFWSQQEKRRAILADVQARHEKGQPILIGVSSISESVAIYQLLVKAGLKCHLLNAHHHQQEAEIVAQAGKKGAITVATNMAGRGTDIKLGGESATPKQKQEVEKLGGLYMLGATRNSLERSDDQLAGRPGRQGAPGEVRFYSSMEDELITSLASKSAPLRRVLKLPNRLVDQLQKSWWGGAQAEGEIRSDSRLYRRLLEFLKEAQDRNAQDDAQLRKQTREYEQALDEQRLVINAQREAIRSKPETELNQDVMRMVADEVRGVAKELLIKNHDLVGFLSWMEGIQPTLEKKGRVFPSWGLKLILDQVLVEVGAESWSSLSLDQSEQVIESLIEMKKEAAVAEQEKIRVAIATLLGQIDMNSSPQVEGIIKAILALAPIEISKPNFGLGSLHKKIADAFWKSSVLTKVKKFFDDQLQAEFSEETILTPPLTQAEVMRLAQQVFQLQSQACLHRVDLELAATQLRQVFNYDEIIRRAVDHLAQAEQFIAQNWETDDVGSTGEVEEKGSAGQALGSSRSVHLRSVLARLSNQEWMSHLDQMGALEARQGLASTGSSDPLTAYNLQAAVLFKQLLGRIQTETVRTIFELKSGRREDLSWGELATQDDLRLEQHQQNLEAIKYQLPPLFFMQHYELVIEAQVVRDSPWEVGSILSLSDKGEFWQDLFLQLNHHVVVFENIFPEEQSLPMASALAAAPLEGNFDVVWTQQIETSTEPSRQLLTQLIKLRALQLRLIVLQRKMVSAQVQEMLDHFAGVTQTLSGLSEKIVLIDQKLTKLAEKLWQHQQSTKN